MVTIIGVRFRNAGKVYYFDPGDEKIPRGVSVIVETTRGLEMGTVIVPNKEVEDDTVVQPLKPVIRIANEDDFNIIKENKLKQKEAFFICKEKIRKHELDMKLVDVEYTFDNNKILFYFTADGRIDFRELVKDLASVFKTRIELRQIGVRDETKMLGGVGICGRGLCCATYLSDFVPVSIRMAKEQNLSLNPTKISGVCGRLMCCLKNEEDTYEYLNSRLPSLGEKVVIKEDNVTGEVQSVNVLRQRVKVLIRKDEDGETEMREVPVESLKFHGRKKHCACEGEVAANEWDENSSMNEDAAAEEELSALEDDGQAMTDSREESNNRGRRDGGEGPRRDRNDRRNRRERSERGERQDRGERSERGERQDRGERSERSERQDRGERSERGERQDRGERSERGERQDRRERSERGERQDRGERSERGERQDRDERSERRDRRNRNDRSERSENGERQDRSERTERSERKDRRNRNDRQSRQDRNESGENVRQNEEGAPSGRDDQQRNRRNDRRRNDRRANRRDNDQNKESAASKE